MVAGVLVGDNRELAVVPFELAGIDDSAADRRAMAADVLRRGDHFYVRAVLEWPEEADPDGVIDNDRYACIVSDLRYRLEVRYI